MLIYIFSIIDINEFYLNTLMKKEKKEKKNIILNHQKVKIKHNQ